MFKTPETEHTKDSDIPVIDLKDFATEGGQADAKRSIAEAMKRLGCFYLVNHGFTDYFSTPA